MTKYLVAHFTTVASSTVRVPITDQMYAAYGIDENSDTATLFDAVEENIDMFAAPEICAQCSGWGQSWSMDLGEWELSEEDGNVSVVDGSEFGE